MPVSKLDKAKAKRTGLLSALTKKIKSAVAEMDGTGDEVRLDSMRKELDDKLKACEQANDAMIELLDEATDVEDAYNWFSEAEESACDCIRSINAHLAPDQTLNASQGSVPAASKSTQVTTAQNTIDAWIDDLDPAKETVIPAEQQLDPTEILMRVIDSTNTSIARLTSKISGMTLLSKHLEGKAAEITSGLGTDTTAYVTALKVLKRRFAHPTIIARAFIDRVTKGEVLPEHEPEALERFHVSIRDCVITLKRLAYDADVRSCETTRQATMRLPQRVREKWAETCRRIREDKRREPHLEDLETWLSNRVAALFDPLLYTEKKTKPQYKTTSHSVTDVPQPNTGGTTPPTPPETTRSSPGASTHRACPACKTNLHFLHQCPEYLAMTPLQKINMVKSCYLCCNCLRPGHSYKICASTTCRINNCGRKHHSTLHENPRLTASENFGRNQRPPAGNSGGKQPDCLDTTPVPVATPPTGTQTNPPVTRTFSAIATTEDAVIGTSPVSSRVFLQILPVKISTPSGIVKDTYALLDNGSQSSLIRRDLADELGLDGEDTELTLGTISNDPVSYTSKRVQFGVHPFTDDGTRYEIPWAWTVPTLNVPAQRLMKGDQLALSELAGYQFENIDSSNIGLLIGANAPEALLPMEVRRTKPGSPVAVRTGLGWTVLGVANGNYSDAARAVTSCQVVRSAADEDLAKLLERFWNTESFGCSYDGHPATSVEDRHALHLLDTKTSHISGRYQVPLLWKEVDPKLPNNYNVALKRYRHLQTKLQQDPERFERYKAVIHAHLRDGYASKMTTDQVKQSTPITHYLPHRDVYNLNKPGKTRVVQDASARCKGTSLNENLLTGPDLLNNLSGVLLNFRGGVVALASDIESMFHRCLVSAHDQDALRFLWNDDVNAYIPDVYQMQVLIFGAKCSPTCAEYALRRCATDNADKFSQLAITTIMDRFYVDDLVTSVHTVEAAIALSKELIRILQTGGFRLTKWASNSREVLAALPTSELAHCDINLDLDKMPLERVLGMRWDPDTDNLVFRTIKPDPATTKRGILKTTATLFDPLGFLAPFGFLAKYLMQQTWTLKLGWDDELPDHIQRQWKMWLADLDNIGHFQVPRCYSPDFWNCDQLQLHVFADASEKGFGSVCYLRMVSPSGGITCAFAIAKCRNAPIKSITIVRLELQAAVLAARLVTQVKETLRLTNRQTYLWSDSLTTLKYIKNTTRRFHTFTSNRVAEIRDLTTSDDWYYVPTHINPADDCSRGVPLSDLVRPHHRWLTGPAFLRRPPDEWPNAVTIDEPAVDDPEVKPEPTVVCTVAVSEPPRLLKIDKFSSLFRLKRVTAWCLRYAANFKAKALKNRTNVVFQGPLSTTELDNALNYWIKTAQCSRFAEEISRLANSSRVSSRSTLLRLQPFLSDGFLRVGGRLPKAPLAYDARHQLILPHDHHLTNLIIIDGHVKVGHHGQEHVLAYVRQRYWIPRARVAVRRLVRSCIICTRRRSQPLIPVMAPLPETRLAINQPVFYSTGLDYYGPVKVKRGRGTEKRWVCIFTCMTVRAVHIELVSSLETDVFILAVKRFAARRGCPRVITSDNATTFHGADRELKDVVAKIDHAGVANALSPNGIEWHFNPPYGPHFGGVWERIVRSVKTTMRVILGTDTYHEDVLYTALVETEAILNSRPLTAVSDDPSDLEALTPNHFLLGRSNPDIPPNVPVSDDKGHRKRWCRAQAIAQHFWRRFRLEYIPQLSPRARWRQPVRNLQANDLVLVADEQTPRYQWTTGRVIQPITGTDGHVRVADILTPKGTIRRPVARLCLLEAAQE